LAYPKEREHLEYLKYVEQWSLGEGAFADQPKMDKDEWRKRMSMGSTDDSTPTTDRRSVNLTGE